MESESFFSANKICCHDIDECLHWGARVDRSCSSMTIHHIEIGGLVSVLTHLVDGFFRIIDNVVDYAAQPHSIIPVSDSATHLVVDDDRHCHIDIPIRCHDLEIPLRSGGRRLVTEREAAVFEKLICFKTSFGNQFVRFEAGGRTVRFNMDAARVERLEKLVDDCTDHALNLFDLWTNPRMVEDNPNTPGCYREIVLNHSPSLAVIAEKDPGFSKTSYLAAYVSPSLLEFLHFNIVSELTLQDFNDLSAKFDEIFGRLLDFEWPGGFDIDVALDEWRATVGTAGTVRMPGWQFAALLWCVIITGPQMSHFPCSANPIACVDKLFRFADSVIETSLTQPASACSSIAS